MKKGFTLAETLITLGIIGIVAAITIPVIITNYQKRQAVSQLKVAYALLSDAVKMSENENGNISQWDFNQGTENFVRQYFEPYLKMSNLGCYYSSNTNPCTSPLSKIGKGKYDYYQMKTLGEPRQVGYDNLYLHSETNGYIYSLANGMLATITAHTGTPGIPTCIIRVDLNGFKGPNVIGKDIFTFSFTQNITLQPGNNQYGQYDKKINQLLAKGGDIYTSGTCHPEGVGSWGIIRGDACSVVIMKNGWEIPKEYPWK